MRIHGVVTGLRLGLLRLSRCHPLHPGGVDLVPLSQNEEREKYARERKDQVGTGDRSERIRTYNFPQSRITDHRINYTSHALNESMLGDLDHLFETLVLEDQNIRLKEMLTSEKN